MAKRNQINVVISNKPEDRELLEVIFSKDEAFLSQFNLKPKDHRAARFKYLTKLAIQMLKNGFTKGEPKFKQSHPEVQPVAKKQQVAKQVVDPSEAVPDIKLDLFKE
jgi:hypothetical protein